MLPGVAFIALFFIGIHAWRYLQWAFQKTELRRSLLAAVPTYLGALGLSLAGAGLFWLVKPDVWSPFWTQPAQAVAGYLIVISCLTLPHAILIECLDGRLRPLCLRWLSQPETPRQSPPKRHSTTSRLATGGAEVGGR